MSRKAFGYLNSFHPSRNRYNNEINDYFLFNDLRNGHSTIHSWDIIDTTERQKEICYLLLKNRRKSAYGNLDGNPLSLNHFKGLDSTIEQQDLDGLVKLNILKAENYAFSIESFDGVDLSDEECAVLQHGNNGKLVIDDLKSSGVLKLKKISVLKTVTALLDKDIIVCEEVRYDFKNTKISTGIFVLIEYFCLLRIFFRRWWLVILMIILLWRKLRLSRWMIISGCLLSGFIRKRIIGKLLRKRLV